MAGNGPNTQVERTFVILHFRTVNLCSEILCDSMDCFWSYLRYFAAKASHKFKFACTVGARK